MNVSKKRAWLNAMLFAGLILIALFGIDAFVRHLASEPQTWETHVRYTWLAKTGERQCVVAVRAGQPKPCKSFTKDEIATFRLHYETPPQHVLVGNF